MVFWPLWLCPCSASVTSVQNSVANLLRQDLDLLLFIYRAFLHCWEEEKKKKKVSTQAVVSRDQGQGVERCKSSCYWPSWAGQSPGGRQASARECWRQSGISCLLESNSSDLSIGTVVRMLHCRRFQRLSSLSCEAAGFMSPLCCLRWLH